MCSPTESTQHMASSIQGAQWMVAVSLLILYSSTGNLVLLWKALRRSFRDEFESAWDKNHLDIFHTLYQF